MRRLMLLAASILAVASMAVFSSAALAFDWNGDGCDEEWEWCPESGYVDWYSIDDPVEFDEACSPSLEDGVYIEGCGFSDPLWDEDEEGDEAFFFGPPDDGDPHFGEDVPPWALPWW